MFNKLFMLSSHFLMHGLMNSCNLRFPAAPSALPIRLLLRFESVGTAGAPIDGVAGAPEGLATQSIRRLASFRLSALSTRSVRAVR